MTATLKEILEEHKYDESRIHITQAVISYIKGYAFESDYDQAPMRIAKDDLGHSVVSQDHLRRWVDEMETHLESLREEHRDKSNTSYRIDKE